EAVGSESALTDAFRVADTRGSVILLGAAGVSKVDMTPVWFKELTVAGSFCHAHDGGSHSIARAFELMSEGAFPASTVVTHHFPLTEFREALTTAGDRASGAIKVVLHP
ncbi:MAG: alcohol dehydrogenase, partial [Acidimicrobiia bacterium]